MAGTQSFPALDNWYSLPEIGEETEDQWKNISLRSIPACPPGPRFARMSGTHQGAKLNPQQEPGRALISGGGSILPSKGISVCFLSLLKCLMARQEAFHEDVKQKVL